MRSSRLAERHAHAVLSRCPLSRARAKTAAALPRRKNASWTPSSPLSLSPSPTTRHHHLPPLRSSYDDASSSSSGSIWESDVVKKEFDTMMRDFRDMMMLQRRFPDFDIDGKEIYLDKLDGLAERMRIFVTRMRLSGDQQAKQWLHLLNIQLLEAGLSVDTLQEGLKASTDTMRLWIAEEQRVSHDPAKAADLRGRLRAHFDSAPDVAALLSDPEVGPSLSDPLVLAALKDAMAIGPTRAMEKYGSNERVMRVLRKLAEVGAKDGDRGGGKS